MSTLLVLVANATIAAAGLPADRARRTTKSAAGVPATSEAAIDLAEQHRQHISRNFYDCSHEIHRQLADMYVTGPQFTKHDEDRAPGLATYVHDAVVANAERTA